MKKTCLSEAWQTSQREASSWSSGLSASAPRPCAASAEAVPWTDQRARILAALASYVRGDDPVYDVTLDSADCFVLVRRRTEPDATYGRGARLCFDERFAALRRLEVDREGARVLPLDA